MGQTYRESNAPIVPGTTNAGFASASHSPESLDWAAACGELKIHEGSSRGQPHRYTCGRSAAMNLFAWCFHLVLRADSLSAAQTYHLNARHSGFQALKCANNPFGCDFNDLR